jgi:hypothetical protein
LRINPKSGTEQDVLAGAVQKVYDIRKDDARLRWILERPAEKRGEFFDSLRRNYPVRREFGNTLIVLEEPCKTVVEKLAGIGFREVRSQK